METNTAPCTAPDALRTITNPIMKDEVTFLETSRKSRGRHTLVEVKLAVGGGVALVQQLRQQGQPSDYRRRFLVKHLSQWVPVNVADIAYFQSEESITLFRIGSGQKFSVDYTLDEIESMLEPALFFRINRQFLIHVNSVQQIQPYFNHKLSLQLKPVPSGEVVVSRERVTDFKKWMGK